MALVKARVGSAAAASGSRQDTIEEELEERRPAGVPYSHEAALAELRRDVRVEVQRLQQKVLTSVMMSTYLFRRNYIRTDFLQLGRVEDLLTMLATRLGAEPTEAGGGASSIAAPASTAIPVPAPTVGEEAASRPTDLAALARKRRSKVRITRP